MVGFTHTGARNQGYLRNLNLTNPTGILADGRPVFSTSVSSRVYPQFGNITLQDIGAIADYEALISQFKHQFAQGYTASVSYTWSHSISDAPDANSFEQNVAIEDPTNRRRDRGNSSVNRPAGPDRQLLHSADIQASELAAAPPGERQPADVPRKRLFGRRSELHVQPQSE